MWYIANGKSTKFVSGGRERLLFVAQLDIVAQLLVSSKK